MTNQPEKTDIHSTADQLADLLGVKPEDVAMFGPEYIGLTNAQARRLLVMARDGQAFRKTQEEFRRIEADFFPARSDS